MEEARGGNGEGGEDGGGCVADSGMTGSGRGVFEVGGGELPGGWDVQRRHRMAAG